MKFCNICVFVTGLICLVLYYVNIKKKISKTQHISKQRPGQRHEQTISLDKMNKWQTCTWKSSQCHHVPGNENSKPDEEVAWPWKWLEWKRMTAAGLRRNWVPDAVWCSGNVSAHMENRTEVSLENKMEENDSNTDNTRNSSNKTLQYAASHGDTCL